MPIIELIAIIAVLQYLMFGYLVGAQRRVSGLKAPQMTGHDGFERMYRVQSNTMECLVAFLPLLLLAANNASVFLVIPLGVCYLVGRTLYWRAYTADPATRGLGFMLTLFPILGLAVLAAIGTILSAF